MLLAERYGQRCSYCAFKARQIGFQQCRARTSSPRIDARSGVTKLQAALAKELSGYNDDRRSRIRGFRRPSSRDHAYTSPMGRITRGRQTFAQLLADRLVAVRHELKKSPILEQLRKEGQDISFSEIWSQLQNAGMETTRGRDEPDKIPIKVDLRRSFAQGGESALDARIKYHFYDLAIGPRFSNADLRNQRLLADLRYPGEWYPSTRLVRRSVHLHVGPTNSGKTYHALQRLEKAETGLYAGPLRLLAHEVYSRLNAKGIKCNLLTGEERRNASGATRGSTSYIGVRAEKEEDDGTTIGAYTVEMVPVNCTFDVAVIDEIQMIGSTERGWAWTEAVLGVKAKELHLCGEERTVPLLQQICASLNDELTIHRYERLSPLRTARESLHGDLKNLQKGDCIVSFSVMGIHALRKQIERKTGKKVATVYGSLPPETRAQQARLFNEPNNDYDYLVASDAIGMGLNLAIRRVIFESVSKFDGVYQRTLPIADIKQIAGRAGRYRIAIPPEGEPEGDQDLEAAKGDNGSTSQPSTENVGIVTTLEEMDLAVVKEAMQSEPEPIRTAGLHPPGIILQQFADYFPPGTPFSYIMTRLHELSQTSGRYHLCNLRDHTWIADLIEPVKNLTIFDRNILCSCPANNRDQISDKIIPVLAHCIAEQREINLLDLSEMPLEILELEPSQDREYLRELERLHKGLGLYLWLSYRFPGVCTTRPLAFHVKSLVEEKIEAALDKMSFSEKAHKKILAKRRLLAETDATGKWTDGGDGTALDALGDNLGLPSHEQSSMTGGTDQFGGGEDIPYEEPQMDEPREGEVDGTAERQGTSHSKPSTIPAKHLPDLDFTPTETKRRIESRP